MEGGVLKQFMDLGAVATMCLAAVGSGLGSGTAGMSAIGAWKKCYAQNKPAPFLLLVYVGAPLTQTIYGMILMNRLTQAVIEGQYFWGLGLLGGLAMGVSAWMQGAAAASACDAYAETGKGFTNYLIVVGIIETVAIFIMVFLLGRVAAFAG